MMEETTQKKQSNVLVLIASICSVVLLVLIALTALLSSRQTRNPTQQVAQGFSNTNEVVSPAINDTNTFTPQSAYTTPPEIKFDAWQNTIQYPTDQQQAPLYSFKQFLTTDDAATIASLLGVNAELKKSGTIVYGSFVQKAQKEAVLFTYNLTSGSLSYANYQGIANTEIKIDTSDFREQLLNYLTAFHLNDSTLAISATYKNRQSPNITYIEAHRDWNIIGRPILSSIGLANVPETQRLSQLNIDTKLSDMIENPDIYNTSDQRDGLARQNDFNTITVGVSDKTHKIISIRSNIRPLQSTTSDAVPLISYTDAYQQLQNNHYDFILTTPAGAGTIPWTRIYPGNVASAKQATITETTIAYLESSPTQSQQYLIPHYIFRGYSHLTSGYLVEFIATVPAINKPQANGKHWSFIKDVYAAIDTPSNDKGQKQSTFDLTPAPTLQPTPFDNKSCVPMSSQLNPVYTVNGVQFGWSNVRLQQGQMNSSRKGWWYYIPSTNSSNFQNDINQVIAQVRSMIGESDFREFDKILEDYQLRGVSCPVRVTGASPTLFVYAPFGTSLSMKPLFQQTYADPQINETDVWNITINQKGLTVNKVTRPYIYYEYEPQPFSKPQEGWNIPKNQLDALAKHIASQLALTAPEANRLSFELHHAAATIAEQSIFIGLMNPQEINTRLPLEISATQFILRRFHFYITKSDNNHPQPPLLSPVVRTPFMIVELGAYHGQ